MDRQKTITHTKNWISSMVIGLGLCPFAERRFNEDTIRYTVTDTARTDILREILVQELELLAASEKTTTVTSFLIHPNVLKDFFEFNAFLSIADNTVGERGLEGIIQVVGFHPEYLFQDAASGAAQNYTNRSPFPMLHLLREDSISEVATNEGELLEIPKRNIQTLEKLGVEKILERLKACVPL